MRTHWDSDKNQWLFSVIDVIGILTDSSLPKRYWSDLKQKLHKEGSEAYENIVRFKMKSSDGKLRETDVADTETLLRIIQSIHSPKTEPFRQWLAKAGYDKMRSIPFQEEMPAGPIKYKYTSEHSENRIQQQLAGLETLHKLASFWKQGEFGKITEPTLLPDKPVNFSDIDKQEDWGED